MVTTNTVPHANAFGADARGRLLAPGHETPVLRSRPSLLAQHHQLIEGSAVSSEVARQRGYQSVTTSQELASFGFADYQRRVPALVIPAWNVHGKVALHQIRPDAPRINKQGKPVKYETPEGSRPVIDVPPFVLNALGDVRESLIITEGIRKADAAVSAGYCCIALMGVWSWRGTDELGNKSALADWDAITLTNRHIYLAFDSDSATNPNVHQALDALARYLTGKGARVRFCDLAREVQHA